MGCGASSSTQDNNPYPHHNDYPPGGPHRGSYPSSSARSHGLNHHYPPPHLDNDGDLIDNPASHHPDETLFNHHRHLMNGRIPNGINYDMPDDYGSDSNNMSHHHLQLPNDFGIEDEEEFLRLTGGNPDLMGGDPLSGDHMMMMSATTNGMLPGNLPVNRGSSRAGIRSETRNMFSRTGGRVTPFMGPMGYGGPNIMSNPHVNSNGVGAMGMMNGGNGINRIRPGGRNRQSNGEVSLMDIPPAHQTPVSCSLFSHHPSIFPSLNLHLDLHTLTHSPMITM